MSKTNDYYSQRPFEHLTDEEINNMLSSKLRQTGNYQLREMLMMEQWLRCGGY